MKESFGRCEVCYWAKGDSAPKTTWYCGLCKSWICAKCWYAPTRLYAAFMKWKASKVA